MNQHAGDVVAQRATAQETLVFESALHRNGLTPTGTQSERVLFWRRLLVAGLNIGTFAIVTAIFSSILATGGWTLIDMGLLVAFMLSTPWTILGLWNALIGLGLILFSRDVMRAVYPYAEGFNENDPVTDRVAICMTLRNEDPERAYARLRLLKASLDGTPYAGQFTYFVLSDTNQADVALAEEAGFARWSAEQADAARLHYRRRDSNPGFKAGNIRDFMDRWGNDHDLMIGLDADSLMSGNAVLKLVRIAQANPRLGILQSLVVGMPSQSAFARVFQFGMRHGMRSYTLGGSWWAGDCGPYWGHNAVVRIAPFKAHCHLPVLPGKPPLGGYVLSHDQVEATLMRRAGYEVRVLPEEMESWEENPPHLLEFTRRDLRWCQGNMQYFSLVGMRGLKPLSRFQLAWAILMYLGAFAWVAFVALGVLKVFDVEPRSGEPYPVALGIGLFATMFTMSLMPKIVGIIDVLLDRKARASYGGAGAVLWGALVEFVFGLLLGPVVAFRVAIFMLGLLLGKTVTWDGQNRDVEGISWATAARGMWPQFVFGLFIWVCLGAYVPAALWWAAPMLAGLLLAVPFAVLTADPAVGRAFARAKICAIPEEFETPPEVAALLGRGATPSPLS